MPWCHKCKTQYRDGFKICADCHTPLSDDPPPEMEEPISEPVKEAYLTTAADEIESEIILSKLESMAIPAIKKYKESGDYLKVYMGNSNFGVDIYVPENALEEAKLLLSDNQIDENEINPEDFAKTKEEVEKQGNLSILFFILIMLAIVIVLLILFT